jgi:2,5-diamino-6-(ribosylamino)-4(3H)-pyrimidinone 5'-phosphate reductase
MDRPYIHINCASTLDGKIARPDGSRLRISGEHDMERVHRLRAEMGAILVGADTVINDDPKLIVKEKFVPDPPELTKIILDGKGRIPASSRFLRTKGTSLIATSESCSGEWFENITEAIEHEDLDAEVIMLPCVNDVFDLSKMLEELNGMKVESVLVEGGSVTISQFVSKGLFDIMTIYYGPMLIGGSGPTIMDRDGISGVDIEDVQRTYEGGILLTIRPSNISR